MLLDREEVIISSLNLSEIISLKILFLLLLLARLEVSLGEEVVTSLTEKLYDEQGEKISHMKNDPE